MFYHKYIRDQSKSLTILLLISMWWSECVCRQTPFPKFSGNTWGVLTGNDFSFKTKLPEPEKELKFTFILVRHGMVLPFDNTFEFDMNRYKFNKLWKTEEGTERGNQLMTMVGRSLRTRYQLYLDTLTWDKISITTIDSPWASVNGEYLLQGLLRKTKHEELLRGQQSGQPTSERINKEGLVDFDRYNLLQSRGAPCNLLSDVLDDLDKELEIPDNTVALEYCTHGLYGELRRFMFTPNTCKKGDLWWIRRPEQVYKLWKLLWFETQEGVGMFLWTKRLWANIVACVFDYFRLQMNWHPDFAPYAIGTVFNKIIEEKENERVKFHIHITDDLTMTPFLWTMPDNPRTLWPDYGDAVILDVYKDDTVTVSLFSGTMEKFETVHTFSYTTLKNYIKQQGLDVTIDDFNKICGFDHRNKK